jgi:hypothetical protein
VSQADEEAASALRVLGEIFSESDRPLACHLEVSPLMRRRYGFFPTPQ